MSPSAPLPRPTFVTALGVHMLAAIDEMGLDRLIPREQLERELAGFALGVGQLLADVELARLRRIPLHEAVHAHESFPYLGRMHGQLRDALMQVVPRELRPLIRSIVAAPVPEWTAGFRNDLCVVARSDAAAPEERALCRLLLFEGILLNLFIPAWRTRGRFEAMGGCWRDLERTAAAALQQMLAVPLAVDAGGDFRPFETTVHAALKRLEQHVRRLWDDRRREPRYDGHGPDAIFALLDQRAQLELTLRKADPIDAAVVRNELAPGHVPPTPMVRLRRQHPTILAGYDTNALEKRLSRAKAKLEKNPRALARANQITLADLIAGTEDRHA